MTDPARCVSVPFALYQRAREGFSGESEATMLAFFNLGFPEVLALGCCCIVLFLAAGGVVGLFIYMNRKNKSGGAPNPAVPAATDRLLADVETCRNCGRAIGKLETPQVWKDAIVCGECHARLTKQR